MNYLKRLFRLSHPQTAVEQQESEYAALIQHLQNQPMPITMHEIGGADALVDKPLPTMEEFLAENPSLTEQNYREYCDGYWNTSRRG
ncbi:hypothetical protein ACQ4M3_07855 [Leptolyngbya sp. AN03gr2]|uniref:hypothetical protein n=1 Tax=unclassified Leptolyngbya TaxID=2650499 RepID=UPI003D31D81F